METKMRTDAVQAATGSWYKGAAIPENSGIVGMSAASWAKVGQKVYIFNQYAAHNYVYSIAEDTWATIDRMPTARYYMSCAAVGHKIYCMGGMWNNAGVANSTNIVEILDTETNTWSAGASMPYTRYNTSCIEVDGYIYCIGGQKSNNVFDGVTQIYDAVNDSWSVVGNAPAAQYLFPPARKAGKLYCLGEAYNMSNAFSILDMDTGVWSKGTNMLSHRRAMSAQECLGGVYSIGGQINFWGELSSDGGVYRFDTGSQTWGACKSTKNWMNFRTLNRKGKLYCVSGGNDYSVFEIYDAALNQWERMEDCPNVKSLMSAVFFEGDRLYCIGGPGNMEVDIYTLEEEGDELWISMRYFTENSLELRTADVKAVRTGGSFTGSVPTIDGYTLLGYHVNGGERIAATSVALYDINDSQIITCVYRRNTTEDLMITEQYLLSVGGEAVRTSTKQMVEAGVDYMQTAPRIEGYKRIGHRIDGGEASEARTAVILEVQADHVVDFLYRPCDGEECIDPEEITIIEKYYDVENEAFIRPDTYAFVAEGNRYGKTAPVLSGYARIGHSIDGGEAGDSLTAVIGEVLGGHVVTFLYEPGQDNGGDGGGTDPGDGGGTGPGDGGHDCDCGCGGGEGCRCGNDCDCGGGDGGGTGPGDGGGADPGDGGGTDPGDGGNGDEIIITERYCDVTKNTYIQADTQTRVAKGGYYSKTAPAISGYFRLGHRVDSGADSAKLTASIAEVKESHVVTFLYQPAVDCDDFVIRERYYDVEHEQYIRPDTETLVEPGADYRKTAPELEGYGRVGHKVDDGAESRSLIAVIENVGEDHTVTFLYTPEEGGGDGPGDGDGDGDGNGPGDGGGNGNGGECPGPGDGCDKGGRCRACGCCPCCCGKYSVQLTVTACDEKSAIRMAKKLMKFK